MNTTSDTPAPAPNPAASAAVEAAYFDSYVDSRGDFDVFHPRAWATLTKRFEAVAGTAGGLRVLDVGCGTGHSRQIYRRRAASYAGIDLSGHAVAMAAGRFAGDAWLVADATTLPFDDASFDVVAFSSVLHHIPDYAVALGEAHRVLRPGGLVFAFDPNALHPAMALLRLPRSPLYSPKGVSPNERPLLGSTLRRAFRAAGFDRVAQRGQSDLPYRNTPIPWVNAVLGLYNAGDWTLEKSGLGRLIGTFLVTTARKPAA